MRLAESLVLKHFNRQQRKFIAFSSLRSGFAVSYNLAFTFFAGLTPLLLTYFIHVTGRLRVPGIYLTVLGWAAFG